MKHFLVFAFTLFLSTSTFSQEIIKPKHQSPPSHDTRNFIGLFVGNTSIVQSGFHLPTIGLEYVREITPNFGLGIITEYELGTHIVQENEAGQIVSEVEREQAFLILPSAFIRIYKGLIFSAGYGVELEHKQNLALSKIGLEYALPLQNFNWKVVPSVSWDHTRLFDGVVYGFIIGCAF